MNLFSINENATLLVEKMVKDSSLLGIDVSTGPEGVCLIDARNGGFEAGKRFAEVCMGGLGEVQFTSLDLESFWLPAVNVHVSQPAIGCIASQYAGWTISVDDYFAMGSGPARALAVIEEVYQKLEYRDSEAESAVLTLETDTMPNEKVVRYIADTCGIKPEKLYILAAPCSSLVGSIQIAARVVETGIHKMMELGFDIKKITSGYGTSPIAPVAEDDLKGIGRTNDCILYGGRVFYTVDEKDEIIESIVKKIPSSSSKDYGRTFYDLFIDYDKDFYKIDPMLFSPAEVFINSLSSGRSFRAGGLNQKVLEKILT